MLTPKLEVRLVRSKSTRGLYLEVDLKHPTRSELSSVGSLQVSQIDGRQLKSATGILAGALGERMFTQYNVNDSELDPSACAAEGEKLFVELMLKVQAAGNLVPNLIIENFREGEERELIATARNF
jgi:hypothetical protein